VFICRLGVMYNLKFHQFDINRDGKGVRALHCCALQHFDLKSAPLSAGKVSFEEFQRVFRQTFETDGIDIAPIEAAVNLLCGDDIPLPMSR